MVRFRSARRTRPRRRLRQRFELSDRSCVGSIKVTKREEEVLSRVARGYSDKQIAELLRIELNTVRNHVRNIREKLGASTRAHAVWLGVEYGLLSPLIIVA
jgi:DNA-binding NarL/FixJ family response regulator